MKVRLVVVSFLISVLGVLIAPGTAYAALPSCSGYTGSGKDVNYSAFIGHKVRATYYWCTGIPSGFVGPVTLSASKFRAVKSVKVSFPTRVPSGFGETLTLTQSPYFYTKTSVDVWKYRFSVEQHQIKVLFGSNYDFELQVRHYGRSAQARLCFVGSGDGCSSWQS